MAWILYLEDAKGVKMKLKHLLITVLGICLIAGSFFTIGGGDLLSKKDKDTGRDSDKGKRIITKFAQTSFESVRANQILLFTTKEKLAIK